MSMTLEEKKALFSEWTPFDDDDDDDVTDEANPKKRKRGHADEAEMQREREHRRKCRAFAQASLAREARGEGHKALVKREEAEVSVLASTVPVSTVPSPLETAPTPTSDPAPAPRGRLFDGLAFYYIPNSNLGPRRLRIAKACQHGARRVQSLAEATHVIVDEKLRWDDLEGTLDREQPPSRILVNENYPLDCVRYGILLSADQEQYAIRESRVPRTDKMDKMDKMGKASKSPGMSKPADRRVRRSRTR